MEAAAILFLESVKPLGFLGSQALVFLRPFATLVVRSPQDYDRLTRLLERRDGIEALLRRLEAPAARREEEEAGERREDRTR
ncbi:MAG: hypothetical protein D6776_10580 [Planctomycetota bacterium]|nr:MAG: hypothetical protein D6776_10580 [Planctomycetota bacterium]